MTGVFEDHLSVDAVVAYVDGELGLTAFQRVAHHLHDCPDCAREVAEQAAAQQALRMAGGPRMPSDLFNSLRAIPVGEPVGATSLLPRTLPLGLPMQSTESNAPIDDRSGRTLDERSLSDRNRGNRSRRARLGAGALVAGLAVGALATGGFGERPAPSRTPPPVTSSVNSPVRAPANPVGPVRMASLSSRH
jgi:anti-sigma factor RsiW